MRLGEKAERGRSMMRVAGAWLVLVGLGGCMSIDSGSQPVGQCPGHYGHGQRPPTIPGVQGAWGQAVPVAAPYNMAPPMTTYQANAMMSRSVPLDMVQINRGAPGLAAVTPGGLTPPTMIPQGGVLSPPGVPFAPGVPAGTSPGAAAAMNVIQATSKGAPAPGIVSAAIPPGAMPPGGITQVNHGAGHPGMRFPAQRTQVRFVRPSGMRVSWFTQGPDGKPSISTTPIEVPGRYNFLQAAIYRLKLSSIEGRPGLEIYPTLEVVPANPKTEAFLAHSSVPVEFTNEDFKQIAEGNYVVKVIYLPDPQFQDVAGTGTDEILSTRLEPGADPITEALRRGSILLVIRMGNMDQEAPNTPAINAPGPHAGPAFLPPQGMPGSGMPFAMPQGTMPPGAMVPPPGYPTNTTIMPPGPAKETMVPSIATPPIPTGPAPRTVPSPVAPAPKAPATSSADSPKTIAVTPATLPAPETVASPMPLPVAPTGLNLSDAPMLPPPVPTVVPPIPANPATPPALPFQKK